MRNLYIQHVGNIILICLGVCLINNWGDVTFKKSTFETFFRVLFAIAILSVGLVSALHSQDAIEDARMKKTGPATR